MPKILARKGAFSLFKTSNIFSKKPTENGAFENIDCSRLSTEENAPLFQHRMPDHTFLSSVGVGAGRNLLASDFYLMFTLLLRSYRLLNVKVSIFSLSWTLKLILTNHNYNKH